jgi:hypothetical protein
MNGPSSTEMALTVKSTVRNVRLNQIDEFPVFVVNGLCLDGSPELKQQHE